MEVRLDLSEFHVAQKPDPRERKRKGNGCGIAVELKVAGLSCTGVTAAAGAASRPVLAP
jgi:hypothetical protein